MVSTLGQVLDREMVSPAPNGRTAATVAATKEIPYDFVARFGPLNGTPGDRHQDVINISTDGAFVAVSIAHSFKFERLSSIQFRERWAANSAVIKLNDWARNRLNIGGIFNLGSSLQEFVQAVSDDVSYPFVGPLATTPTPGIWFDPRYLLIKWFGFDFKYSIVDSGSGRELQNFAVPSIAGLGNADGDRPFRTFPKPMLFMPRSTIRIEVEEVSEGLLYAGAELNIVLHGYKILGYGT